MWYSPKCPIWRYCTFFLNWAFKVKQLNSNWFRSKSLHGIFVPNLLWHQSLVLDCLLCEFQPSYAIKLGLISGVTVVRSFPPKDQTSYFKNRSLDLTLSDYHAGTHNMFRQLKRDTFSSVFEASGKPKELSGNFPMGGPSGNQTFHWGCAPRESLISLGTSLGQIFPDNSCRFSTVCPRYPSAPLWTWTEGPIRSCGNCKEKPPMQPQRLFYSFTRVKTV